MEPLGALALLCMASGAAMLGVGVLRSGVGLRPQVAFAAGLDVETATARAAQDAVRRRWARVAAFGFTLTLLGIALLALAA